MIILKNHLEIERIGRACSVLKQVFEDVTPVMVPGSRTRDVDRLVEESIRSRGGRPAFKGYPGPENIPFPASSCISIDDEVVHGIPSERLFEEGQIVGLDIGVELDGYYADAARTFLIGDVSAEVRRLVEITRQCLDRGIAQARAGHHLSDISNAVQSWAEKHGYSVVRELTGHGVGKALHEDPQIPNYGLPGRGPKLLPGMTIAIEPMINLGGREIVTDADGWTVLTADGLPSAHWEETIAITDGDPLILTRDVRNA